MSLTQGGVLPDVNTTTTSTTTAPDYYTNYLTDIAKAGQSGISMDPTKMVAGFTDLQKQGFSGIQPAADAYKTGLSGAQATADLVAKGVTPGAIQSFMSPYTTNVVNEMERLQQQNIQRNLMPALKSGFVGSGDLGSRRYAGALGQTSADWQSNLLGQQTGALQKGYSDAVNAALQNAQLQNQAAITQGNLAAKAQELGLTGTEALLNAGAKQQAQEQAKIEAPLKMATNAAALLRGYTVPTTVKQEYKGPMPGAYAASPLQQIAGIAALLASGSNTALGRSILSKYINSASSGGGAGGGAGGGGNDTLPGGGTVVSNPDQEMEDWYNSLTDEERDYLNAVDPQDEIVD